MDISFENRTYQMFDTDISIVPRKDKLTIEEIDILEKFPDCRRVRIMGLTQETFEYFITKYGRQLSVIYFFKNKLVEDWSLLGTLPELERVGYFHNQRITKLWDMSKNISLKMLEIMDFSRLHSIEGIEKAPALQWFSIGNEIWSTAVIESFACLKNTRIRRLEFSGKEITDNDFSFLGHMPELEVLILPSNYLTTEQIAWIDANYPHIIGHFIAPYIKYEIEGRTRIIINGKRKPSFDLEGNEDRLMKYEKKYHELVKKMKGAEYPK